MENKTIKYHLDFGGFYESIHSHSIELAIAYHYDDEGVGVDYHDLEDHPEFNEDNIDFNAMQLDYAEQWFNLYQERIFSRGQFCGLWRPEYYNYETDKIVVEISEAKVQEIIEASSEDYDIRHFIDEHSQSYDGFNSFYEGFDNVIKNPSVFMMYYTRFLSDLYKDDIEYFFEHIYVEVQFKNKEEVTA